MGVYVCVCLCVCLCSHHLLRSLIKEAVWTQEVLQLTSLGTLGLIYLGSSCRVLPLRAPRARAHTPTHTVNHLCILSYLAASTHCSFCLLIFCYLPSFSISPSLFPSCSFVLLLLCKLKLEIPLIFLLHPQFVFAPLSFHSPFLSPSIKSRSFCNIEPQLLPCMTYTHISPGNHAFTLHRAPSSILVPSILPSLEVVLGARGWVWNLTLLCFDLALLP